MDLSSSGAYPFVVAAYAHAAYMPNGIRAFMVQTIKSRAIHSDGERTIRRERKAWKVPSHDATSPSKQS